MKTTTPEITAALNEAGIPGTEFRPEDIAWAASKLGVEISDDTQAAADEYHEAKRAEARRMERRMRGGTRKIDRHTDTGYTDRS